MYDCDDDDDDDEEEEEEDKNEDGDDRANGRHKSDVEDDVFATGGHCRTMTKIRKKGNTMPDLAHSLHSNSSPLCVRTSISTNSCLVLCLRSLTVLIRVCTLSVGS